MGLTDNIPEKMWVAERAQRKLGAPAETGRFDLREEYRHAPGESQGDEGRKR